MANQRRPTSFYSTKRLFCLAAGTVAVALTATNAAKFFASCPSCGPRMCDTYASKIEDVLPKQNCQQLCASKCLQAGSAQGVADCMLRYPMCDTPHAVPSQSNSNGKSNNPSIELQAAMYEKEEDSFCPNRDIKQCTKVPQSAPTQAHDSECKDYKSTSPDIPDAACPAICSRVCPERQPTSSVQKCMKSISVCEKTSSSTTEDDEDSESTAEEVEEKGEDDSTSTDAEAEVDDSVEKTKQASEEDSEEDSETEQSDEDAAGEVTQPNDEEDKTETRSAASTKVAGGAVSGVFDGRKDAIKKNKKSREHTSADAPQAVISASVLALGTLMFGGSFL